MKTLTRILDIILKQSLIYLLAAMVIAVSWQVFSRYILGSPSSWTEEVARFLLIWISILGAAYAFRTGVHLGLDILPKKLSGGPARALRLFTMLVIIGFSFSVLVIGGSSLVALTWELKQYSAVLGLPIAFVYSVIPISGALICIYAIAAASVEDSGNTEEPANTGS
jgi:TRAP-type C4-dicarboxylate transport system permease small subunit